MTTEFHALKRFLLASDFDRTLSFDDSGMVLSELIGLGGFEERAEGMARNHLVQRGGELTYLLLHDPDFRRVRKEDLIETGRRIRLKENVDLLLQILHEGLDGCAFGVYVISAAPQEVIESALEGIISAERIFGTRLNYDSKTGEIESLAHVSAGHGKAAVLDELQDRLAMAPDQIVYVGDGSSDVHVMLHVNRRGGYTVAVSENMNVVPIARRTVLSDNALSTLVPILEDLLQWNASRIRELFATHSLRIQDWEKMHTDRLTLRA